MPRHHFLVNRVGIDLFWRRQQGLWAERAYYLGLGESAALVDVQQGGWWACGGARRRSRYEGDWKACSAADAATTRGKRPFISMWRDDPKEIG